jgi:hypothetical protein
MRQALLVVVVFAAAFGVAWLLFSGVGVGRRSPEPERTPPGPARAEPNVVGGSPVARSEGGRTPTTESGAADSGAGGGADFPPGARKDLGVILAVYRHDPAVAPGEVAIKLTPEKGRLYSQDAQGFLFIDLDPGVYYVSVASPSVVAKAATAVVRAGEVAQVDLDLESGETIEGIVLDGLTAEPVTGATVELGGLQMQTDMWGRFKTPAPLPHRALEKVTAWAPDYDRSEARLLSVQNVKDVRLALNRGVGEVIGEFVLGPGVQKPPEHAIARLYRTYEQNRQLRRELVVRNSIDFKMSRVVPDKYQLEIEFPGTKMPRRFFDVNLVEALGEAVQIPVGKGGRIDGTVYSHGRRFGPTALSLVDDQGRVYGDASVGKDGAFSFDYLKPGRYALRFLGRQPFLQTEAFTLPDEKPLAVDVDFDLGRVFESK